MLTSVRRVLQTRISVRAYSDAVHEHFKRPRNVGSFNKTEDNIGFVSLLFFVTCRTAVVGKAACGDMIKMQVKIDENGVIQDAKFKAFGCGSAIASSSYATELIKGKTVNEALQLKNTDIAEFLNLPPVKIHCSLLAEDAVRMAVEDWQKQKETAKSTQ